MVAEATAFVLERLAKSLTDDGLARDTVEAVLPTSRDFLDLKARAQALQEFRAGDKWDDLVTVFTRPANLAKKLPDDEAAEAAAEPDGGVEPAQASTRSCSRWTPKRRCSRPTRGGGQGGAGVERRQYGEALTALAALRPAVDRYFDDVLVMAKEEDVKLNRLRQLAAIAALVRRVAALELIQA